MGVQKLELELGNCIDRAFGSNPYDETENVGFRMVASDATTRAIEMLSMSSVRGDVIQDIKKIKFPLSIKLTMTWDDGMVSKKKDIDLSHMTLDAIEDDFRDGTLDGRLMEQGSKLAIKERITLWETLRNQSIINGCGL